MPRNNKSQKGSALIYVIVGVALFGFLMYTLIKGGSTSRSFASKGNEKTLAIQLINYGDKMETAAQKMLMRGCGELGINYRSRSVYPGSCFHWSNYESAINPISGGNDQCFMFYPNGGGMDSPKLDLKMFDTTTINTCSTTLHGFGIDNTIQVIGVGNGGGSGTCPSCETVFGARGLTKGVCEQINNILGYNLTSVPLNNGDYTITNPYSPHTSYLLYDTVGTGGTAVFAGKTKFCVKENIAGGLYVYIHVLIPR